eukprot:scaffold105521_cov60-Attheya_sp.AAC.1
MASFVVPFQYGGTLRNNVVLRSATKDIQLDAFDFSSQKGWDDFYEATPGSTMEEFEWHSSIPWTDVWSEIRSPTSPCLVIGCGNSALPRQLHDAGERNMHVTCLDYSQPCVDKLKQIHNDRLETMSFICGDATRLTETLHGKKYGVHVPQHYTTIVDKGLVDALMCGEGWNTDVERLMKSVPGVLDDGGIYILISYRLSPSTKEFLSTLGESLGLLWSFDIPNKSNDRVSFSVAQQNPTR